MTSTAYNAMTFTGQFRHGVDAKKRITIPADWRSGEEGVLYVRLHSLGTHVVVQPPAELERTVALIESRTEVSVAKRQQLVRAVASGAQRCCADKQGRVVLPPEFCAKANLQGDVVLVGVHKQFEIWNAERWDALQAAEAGETANLASELGL